MHAIRKDRLFEGSEEVNRVTVGIQNGRVTLTPERVPRFLMGPVPIGGEPGEEFVDFGRRVAQEGEPNALTAGRWQPIGIEAADHFHGIPGDAQAGSR